MPAVCRIVAGVSGSPGSVHALRHAADLARHHDATPIPLLAWAPPGGDLADRKSPDPQLRQLWKDDAWQRLWEALGTAFGDLPAGIATQPVVLRGKPGKALTLLARQPGDLLVIGAGRQSPLLRLGAAVSAGTAWPTPTARYWPSRPPRSPASRPWPARLGAANLREGRDTSPGFACSKILGEPA
jgi:nucleotide-binding universal stress UspA family protein